MIGFSCINCGHSFGVQDDYLGKRIKCPKCDYVGEVIDDSGRIKIICQNCGNENNVPETLTGQEIKCPKCNDIIVAAAEEKESVAETVEQPKGKKPETPKDSEISERSLIIIISATAAVIVIGLIIMAAVIPSYKARRARKSQELQSRQQANDTQQTEQVTQRTRPDTSRRRYRKSRREPPKWCHILVFGVAIPWFIIYICFVACWCPKCNKMWAKKRISPFFHFGSFDEYECKYCGHISQHQKGSP